MSTLRTLYLLADGGGTKTTIRLLDENLQIIGEAKSTSGNIKTSPEGAWQSTEKALLELIDQSELKKVQVIAVMGMAGFESEKSKEKFIQTKPNYIYSLDLISDGQIACIGSHAGKDGALVIIGTGVKGFQVEGDKTSEVAGWGFPYSDEGGGAWIGMEAIRLTFRAIDKRIKPSMLTEKILSSYENNPSKLLDHVIKATPKEFGDFCRDVVYCALENDKEAIDLLKSAANEILEVIDSLKEKQHSKTLLSA